MARQGDEASEAEQVLAYVATRREQIRAELAALKAAEKAAWRVLWHANGRKRERVSEKDG